MHVSVAESLTALVSKYLDCVLAAQQEEVEQFFSPIIGRARVREAINALQAARELSLRARWRPRDAAGFVAAAAAAHPADHEFKPRPKFEPLPPRPGMPLVERRPRKTALPGRSQSLPGRTPARNERSRKVDHRHRRPGGIGQEHDCRPPGEEARLHQSRKRGHVSRAGAEGDGTEGAAGRCAMRCDSWRRIP